MLEIGFMRADTIPAKGKGRLKKGNIILPLRFINVMTF